MPSPDLRRNQHFNLLLLVTRLLACGEPFALMRVEQIDLVQHFNARLAQRLELAEHFLHLRLLFFAVG